MSVWLRARALEGVSGEEFGEVILSADAKRESIFRGSAACCDLQSTKLTGVMFASQKQRNFSLPAFNLIAQF